MSPTSRSALPEYVGVLNSAPNATFGVAGTSGVLQCVPLAPRMAGLTLRTSSEGSRLLRVFDLHQRHGEDQGLVRRNRIAGAVGAITQV